jgi:perosamine synthetase
MTNLQAAIGLAQTERLESLVDRRRHNARLYSERLAGVRGLTVPVEMEWARNVFWMYSILIGDQFGCSRDELRRRLARRGIETRTMFVPMHLQPVFFEQYRGKSFPISEALCRTGMYLPSSPSLTEADIDYITTEIRRTQ